MSSLATTLSPPAIKASEQSRARYPEEDGFIERDGVHVFYERYGEGKETVLLLPPWSIVHSRVWKLQIPYLARHFRVLTFDGRGNGRSDRPPGARCYRIEEYVWDALGVMDVTGTERATLVGYSRGAARALTLAAEHPERVARMVLVAPAARMTPWPPLAASKAAFEVRGTLRRLRAGATAGSRATFADPAVLRSRTFRRMMRRAGPLALSRHMSREAWEEDYRGFLEWFFALAVPEAHSTKLVEDMVGWGCETTPETLADTFVGEPFPRREAVLAMAERIDCPVLVVHGEHDVICPHEWGAAVAEATGGRLVTFERTGHGLPGRQPVRFNLVLRDFIEPRARPRDPTVHHRDDGRPRALFVSSPIGLGHARRDVAIARELRAIVGDLQIEWLAQDPLTRVLEAEGESIHRASEHLASESGHFESESAEHDLHCFHAFRRMDEILCSNFMVFHDAVREGRYDLVVGDEAWELDYYLHENPGEKHAPYAWLTDFVGFMPVAGDSDRNRFLAADYNGQMVEHVEGLPGVRDRSIFVGNPEDIVADRLGPDLPEVRDWTERHFDFAGYITGFEPVADRDALRAELGYAPDERVCLVTVGGSGVGLPLLRRVADAYEHARSAIPGLRMVIVAGPRIDPASLAAPQGVEVRRYVHDLYRHLAACDVAVVQGGLTTAMELTANRRPFLYFPLKHHFEQQVHVHHRLRRYRAGRRMDYDAAAPELIAEAIVQELGREVDYRAVETDGARRAAARIAELL
jgi:pimeloyl-ACP methyl ester carboxylesterase/predicted glycosyltransferase